MNIFKKIANFIENERANSKDSTFAPNSCEKTIKIGPVRLERTVLPKATREFKVHPGVKVLQVVCILFLSWTIMSCSPKSGCHRKNPYHNHAIRSF